MYKTAKDAFYDYENLRAISIINDGTLPGQNKAHGFVLFLLDLVADGELDANKARQFAWEYGRYS